MQNEIKTMIDDVIVTEIANLSAMDSGSEEKKAAIDNLKKLCELRVEEVKLDQAEREKREEFRTKWAQIDAQTKDRFINIGLQISLTVASLIAYDIWYRRGLKFEETGTITAPMTRNLLGRLLPGKR